MKQKTPALPFDLPADITNLEAIFYGAMFANSIEGIRDDPQAQWLVIIAMRSYQRGLAAGAIIAKTGLLVKDRFGARTKINPAVAIEARSFATVIQTLRALNVENPALLPPKR